MNDSASPTAVLTIPLSVSPQDTARRAVRVRGALAIAGAWTAYGLVHGAFWLATIDDSAVGFRLSHYGWVVVVALIIAWGWALLTPFIFRLTRLAAPSRIGWLWSIGVHIVTVALITAGMTWLRIALIRAFMDLDSDYWVRLVFWADVNLFTYIAVILTGWAIQAHSRYVDRGLRAHVLETQLARAQLHYLELQLQPHFLFNSLNAIQELAHEAPALAERMLRRLHALLAMSLERSGRDEVTLRDELLALEPYVDIQRTRFEWLSVSIRADEGAQAALVPHLILQPLVENAIRHGLAVRRGPGHIDIVAERLGTRLLVQVRDDGVGLAPLAFRNRPGIGLRNARERLRQLYGADHRFELHEAPRGGVIVSIDVPFRAAADLKRVASWEDLGRSRETIPEVSPDAVAAWRTGEFVAPVNTPNEWKPTVALNGARAASKHAEPSSESIDEAPPGNTAKDDWTTSPPLLSPRLWAGLAGVWVGAALLWIAQIRLLDRMTDPTITSIDLTEVKIQLAGAAYWMLISPLVLFMAREFRLERGRMAANLAINVFTALALSIGFLFVPGLLGLSTDRVFAGLNLNPLSGNFFVYFCILAWSHSRDFVAWYRARELTAAELTAEIARSRFQSLCVQVRPQFLLGTLELVARLVHEDVPRADRLIARLADVLRLTLDMARERMTTLRQELQLLSVTVDAHRLGIRPDVSLTLDVDPLTLGTEMPSRLLCTMADDLLAADPATLAAPLVIDVRAEHGADATRVRLRGTTAWRERRASPHAWWRTKSAADAAVASARPPVSVAFPDRDTAVLIIAEDAVQSGMAPAAA